jgi:hypothetical protein
MRVLITSGVGIEFPLGAGALFGEIVGMRLAHCRDDRPLALPRISPALLASERLPMVA